MGRWSRTELEDEFEKFQARTLRAATTHDWREWADQFTPDATYVEHHFGTFGGREAIYKWIQSTMNTPPNNEMTFFPVDWYVIDEQRGWIVCRVAHRMQDPGDGSVHETSAFTLLKYAGNGMWNYAEDVYNPVQSAKMLERYGKHKKLLETESS